MAPPRTENSHFNRESEAELSGHDPCRSSPTFGPDSEYNTLMAASTHEEMVKIIETRLHTIGPGGQTWLTELGSNPQEIATFLLEAKEQSPWIGFQPWVIDRKTPNPSFHIPNCHHLGALQQRVATEVGLRDDRLSVDFRNVRETVVSLCGLAGVLPDRPDRSEWNGAVEFGDKSKATVRYDFDNASLQTLLDRVVNAMTGICTATATLQEEAGCCERFTVLCKDPGKSFVEMRLITFQDIVRLHQALVAASVDDMQSLQRSTRAAITILQCLPLHDENSCTLELRTTDVSDYLHICALVAQFLSLAFVMYCHGHCGPLSPFFLEHNLVTFNLTGTATTTDNKPYIRAGPDHLTCFHTFIKGPVIVFSVSSSAQSLPGPHDLLATASDIVGAWGPCNFVLNTESKIPDQICGIDLRGGMIFSPERNCYQWAEYEDHPEVRPGFNWGFEERVLIKPSVDRAQC